MPLNRIERVLAFVIGSVGGLSIVAIVAIFVARAAKVPFTGGVWPAVAILPEIGLPITLVLLVVFLVLTAVRRARLARDAG